MGTIPIESLSISTKLWRLWQSRGERIIQIITTIKNEAKPTEEDIEFLNGVQEKLGQKQAKLQVLKSDVSVREDKLALLRNMRSEGVMILERGELEDYYPPIITGADKTAKAADFRNKVITRDAALALATDVPVSCGRTRNEFEAIFGRVFDGIDAPEEVDSNSGA